jgi:hypothetical protein
LEKAQTSKASEIIVAVARTVALGFLWCVELIVPKGSETEIEVD